MAVGVDQMLAGIERRCQATKRIDRCYAGLSSHNRHCIGLDVESSSKALSCNLALGGRDGGGGVFWGFFSMTDASFSPLPTLKRP